MKRIIKKRQRGKTTDLVNEIKQNGGILVVLNQLAKEYVISKFGLGEAQVVTATTLKRLEKDVPDDTKIYVDDVEHVVGILLREYGVVEGVSITNEE